MRKFITIFLLLLHVNTSMFIPVMDEVDFYNAHGVQVDDINSTIEYVDQVVMGHEDTTPEDEDDDQAHHFNIAHLKAFVAPRFIITEPVKKEQFISWIEKPDYAVRAEDKWTSVVHDIVVPPPKA